MVTIDTAGPARNRAEVLVVDDEPAVLHSLEQFLRREGYSVLTAESGEYALEIIRGSNIDLVLMDIKMPGMDGITTLREMKRINPMLKTIIVTADGSPDKMVEAFNSGAYDYMVKPIDLLSLRQLVFSRLR